MDDPDALLLLTGSQQPSALDQPRLLVDRPFPSLSQFPPAWLDSELSARWRYKLVHCQDYVRLLQMRPD